MSLTVERPTYNAKTLATLGRKFDMRNRARRLAKKPPTSMQSFIGCVVASKKLGLVEG